MLNYGWISFLHLGMLALSNYATVLHSCTLSIAKKKQQINKTKHEFKKIKDPYIASIFRFRSLFFLL